MAFNLSGGAGSSGFGGRRSRGLPAMSEINVTPFVDVALVLLIIFMITAHVMEYGLEVEVPKTKTVASSTKDLPTISISKTGEMTLGSSPTKLVQLVSEIHARYPGQTAVYIRADRQTRWDPILQVASVLGDAKFAINFVSQPDDTIGKRR